MAKCLWISSTLTETGDYIDCLKDRGHVITTVSFACEALPKLSSDQYGLYFLNPYFLSWGRIEDYPNGVSLDDYIGLGLLAYDKIREKTSAPLILVPLGIRREFDLVKKLEDRIKSDSFD